MARIVVDLRNTSSLKLPSTAVSTVAIVL